MQTLWWTPILLIFTRYLAGVIVGAVVGRIGEDDAKTLYDTLTGPEFITGLLASLAMAYFGIQSYIKNRREVLTATAKDSPASMTQEQVAELARTSAPSLSTPADKVPKLQKPEA